MRQQYSREYSASASTFSADALLRHTHDLMAGNVHSWIPDFMVHRFSNRVRGSLMLDARGSCTQRV